MNEKVRNQTLSIYNTIHVLTATIYVVLLQIVQKFTQDELLSEAFNRMFTYDEGSLLWKAFSRDAVELICEILIYGAGYAILYFIVKWVYTRRWKRQNRSCYLEGTWYHIHYGNDQDDYYIRCGVVEIRQNFYDLEIEAKNFNPLSLYKGEDNVIKLQIDPRNITYWSHDTCTLSDQGDIIGAYSSSKLSGSHVTVQGIHQFHVIDHNSENYPVELGGFFADTCSKDKCGNIRMYRERRKSFRKQLREKINWMLRRDCLECVELPEKENVELSLEGAPQDWLNTLSVLMKKRKPQ
ncbi:MAG: hypothetical protein HFE85_00790 [Clostridiales bacterium]|nr:hypothetical protein [Clostridiales bacterium]